MANHFKKEGPVHDELEADNGQQGAYEEQPAYTEQSAYGYDEQSAYTEQPAYGYDEQAGYAEQTEYAEQAGYAYDEQADYAYDEQAGYAEQSAYAYDEQSAYGYTEQPAYAEQPASVAAHEEPYFVPTRPEDLLLAAEEEKKGMPAWLDLLITCAVTVGVVVLLRMFVADTYQVPTGSMLETIQLNDRLIGEKITYYVRTPMAGEVVTFTDPTDPSTILIKRVIATEGQKVDLVNGKVVVDGKELNEPYVLGKPSDPLPNHANMLEGPIEYPYEVPQGHVWVMGDNRTNSLDSRYFGAVDVKTVSARAVFTFWPFSDAGFFERPTY